MYFLCNYLIQRLHSNEIDQNGTAKSYDLPYSIYQNQSYVVYDATGLGVEVSDDS
ncbi:MAG: hypothetical protein NPMRTH1_1440036 [Nitrosopumilales archaeon]|nr:MAG: hypothetical protein NPMRTH1_1440036 [Nitrosopumilales archaeon]